HVEDAQDVAERLLAGGPDRDARVRARRLEEPRDRVRDRAPVSPEVESNQYVERLGDRPREIGEQRFVPLPKRMQVLLRVTKREEHVVGEREEGAVERRVDRVGVVRPFDRAEGIAERDHLFAFVEAPSTHEDVRDAARLERADVRTRDVAPEALETLEEEADV